MEEAPEFITVPADPQFHKSVSFPLPVGTDWQMELVGGFPQDFVCGLSLFLYI